MSAPPCNGCGLCCAVQVCPLGRIIYGPEAPTPCPGLALVGGRFRCMPLTASAFIGGEGDARLREALGVGLGCTADLSDVTVPSNWPGPLPPVPTREA